jgi:hypothetical protein
MNIAAVAIDLAKNVFQVHAARCAGQGCAAQAAAAGTGRLQLATVGQEPPVAKAGAGTSLGQSDRDPTGSCL